MIYTKDMTDVEYDIAVNDCNSSFELLWDIAKKNERSIKQFEKDIDFDFHCLELTMKYEDDFIREAFINFIQELKLTHDIIN